MCSSRGSMLQEDVEFFFGPKHPAIQADRPYKVCFSDAGFTGPFVDTGIVMMAEDECVQLEVGGENINDGRYLTIPPIEDIVLGLVKGQFFENEFAPNDTISLISIAGTQFSCFTSTKVQILTSSRQTTPFRSSPSQEVVRVLSTIRLCTPPPPLGM